MQVTDGRDHLVEMQLGLGFIELGFLDDLVEQFSALGELQDYVEEVGCVDHVLEVDDAGMGGGAQDPHLIKDSEQSRLGDQITKYYFKRILRISVGGSAAQSAVGPLIDYFNGNPVEVRDPETKPHLIVE